MLRNAVIRPFVFVALVGLATSARAVMFNLDTTMRIELRDPAGLPEALVLTGLTVWDVPFEGPGAGDASDDNGNGLDEIPTELLSMNLTGTSSLGSMQLQLRTGTTAAGELEEKVNNNTGLLDLDPFAPGDATNFFEILFDLEVTPAGTQLHTESLLRFASMIGDLPGLNELYETPSSAPLLYANANPTGFALGPGNFVFVAERPVPEPGTGLLFLAAVASIAHVAERRRGPTDSRRTPGS